MIYVMLLWVGLLNGGPATISGFDSLEACDLQKQAVIDSYSKIVGYNNPAIRASCMELRTGARQ